MKLALASQMAAIDRRAIEEVGLPGVVLMESAGRAVAEVCRERWPRARRCCVVCGPGNNGGDGFVAARTLFNRGWRTRVFLLGSGAQVRGDAALHLEILRRSGVEVEELAREDDLEALARSLDEADLAVDALFGTGLSRPIEGLASRAVEALNRAAGPVVAADIPSGISADTGAILGCAVRAAVTVTMGLPKVGLLLHPGAAFTGDIQVAEIGFPRRDLEAEELEGTLLDPATVAPMLPLRAPTAHKGTCGRVLVVAGSERYPGAAVLATEGALRVGAGLVTAAVPARIRELVAGCLPQALSVPLCSQGGRLAPGDVTLLRDLLAGMDALCVGPGLDRGGDTAEALQALLAVRDIPRVVDADALRVLPASGPLPEGAVLTPHPGEMAALMEVPTREIQADRVGWARRCARRYHAVTVLKGAPTVVADPAGRYWVNSSGGPVLAQGGTGDVLAGAIAGLLAQGSSPTEAACAAVYLHGLAGDRCARELGPRGVSAAEVARALPRALGAVLVGEGRGEGND